MKKFIKYTVISILSFFLGMSSLKAQTSNKFPYPVIDGHITLVLPCGPITQVLPYLATSLEEKIIFQKNHEDLAIRFIYLENKKNKTWTLLAVSTVSDSSCIISHDTVKLGLGVNFNLNN